MQNNLPERYRQFAMDHTDVWAAYESLGAAAAADGPLDEQTRELIRLAMASAIRAESVVHSHTHRALNAGATEEAVIQTVMLGITTIGFPAMMTALTWTNAAIDAHE